MQADEREAVLKQLAAAKPALEDELRGVSEDQAGFRPAPDAWSIRDCVEHIALTEATMFHLITAGSVPVESPGQKGREEGFLKHSTNRHRKFTAPEGLRPSGRYATLEIAMEEFSSRRERTMRYVETDGDALRAHKTQHPVAGEITCRECLSLIIGHPLRHVEQMRDIKRHPDYPRPG